MKFDKLLDKVIQLEGGYKIHKNPGEKAVTYAGIYRKAHPDWEGWKYLDKGEVPPYQLVRDFYYNNFYIYFASIPYETVKAFLFDTAVNVGVKTAVKMLQKIVGVEADGIIGNQTLSKVKEYVKKYSESELLKDLTLTRIAFYLQLSNKNPKRYGIFLRGWLNRTFEILNFIETHIGE